MIQQQPNNNNNNQNPQILEQILSKQTYKQLQENLFQQFPIYHDKFKALQIASDLIIKCPKQIVNLFECQQLIQSQDHNFGKFINAWVSLLNFLLEICKEMPLNVNLIFDKCYFSVMESKKTVNFVTYIIIKAEYFQSKREMLAEEQVTDGSMDGKVKNLISSLIKIFGYFIRNCSNIRQSSLYRICQILCNRYHHKKLSVQSLEITEAFLHTMSIQTNKSSATNIFEAEIPKPFIYFDGSARIGLRLLLTHNKWPFVKGFHLCLWLKNLGKSKDKNQSETILHIKTDDNKSLRILKQRQQLAVQCISGNEKSYRKVCDLLNNVPVKLQIILDSRESGLFKSNQYQLHIGVNGNINRNIQVKVPKFAPSSFITEFNLLQNYLGQFYSLILASTPINLPKYLLSQAQISQFISNNIQSQSILSILSPMRIHKGIIINQINSQQNHACHQAKQIFPNVSSLRNTLSSPQICLVLLYFCCCLYQSQKKQLDRKQLNKIFNKILVDFCTQYQFVQAAITNNNMINPQLANLFILYFLEVASYPITQVTLNNLVDAACMGSLSGGCLVKYLDFYGVLLSKGLNVDKALVNYRKKVSQAAEENVDDVILNKSTNDNQLIQADPVAKLQLLYLLETQWKKIWKKLQYTCQWWLPNISLQRDTPFTDNTYTYNSKLETQAIKFEWTVSQFITNDFCDCLLLPEIIIPSYGNFNNYREMYIKKQCMSQDFVELSISECFLNVAPGSRIRKYYFKQVSKSILGRIKQRISHNKQFTSETKVKQIQYDGLHTLAVQNQQVYFSASICYINLLTLFSGTISIHKCPSSSSSTNNSSSSNNKSQKNNNNNAIITFHTKHQQKLRDHLCVKAFKNQEYISIFINTADIKFIRKRRYNQSMNGMEIRLKSGINYLFYFYGDYMGNNHTVGAKNLDTFINTVTKFGITEKQISKDPYQDYLKSHYTIQWIDKQISNYQYLQYLNDVSGRSYSDITQYPVLPWIYISNQQQVQFKQQNFRDLTKNMGSIGPQQRIQHFLQKFQTINQTQIFGQYHFGTHYSSSAIIFNYLIRLQPFSTGAITLQSGKFDCADRVFSSYIGSWLNATNSPTDIRELVPQVYLLPQMMINVNNYNFGQTQLKQTICNVELPKWCKRNPYIFCANLRKGLENKYTSSFIKNWIDLIYGYKQKGKAAVQSMNIFFPLTYQLAINVDKIGDIDQRTSIQTQIAHFGQNPAQIIGSSPHPDRRLLKQKWQDKLIPDCNDLLIQRCNLSKITVIKQQKFIYQSVFEDKNSVLAIKFITDNVFVVVRRYQFLIFKILNEKTGFISKEKEIDYRIEKDNISLDYINIPNAVPMVIIEDYYALVGGFYDGNIQIIFLKEVSYSGNLKLPFRTISALAYDSTYQYLYVGDSIGYLGVFQLSNAVRDVSLSQKFYDRVHADRINCIQTNHKANLFITASQDGSVKLFNLYSIQLYRKIVNPSHCSVIFANISTCPLYSLIFYSSEDSKIYSYSINGQYLAQKQQKTGFIYNLSLHQNSEHIQHVVSLNAQREIYIDEMPFLKNKKIIRLKKDNYRISCFELTRQIALAGSQDGGLQIIADPSSF